MQGYSSLIIDGALITIVLAVSSLVLAVILGMICAVGKRSSIKIISILCQVYTSVIRGIPDLVLMFLIFYGLQFFINLMTDHFDSDFIEVDPLVTGTITLGFIYGAYFTETFRGAYQSVPKDTLDAGIALGLNRQQVFFHVMFPLMMRFALPGIANNWQVILKATALVSLLGLSDLVRAAKIAGESSYQPLYFSLIVGGFYLAFTTVSNIVFWWLEKYYSIGITRVRSKKA